MYGGKHIAEGGTTLVFAGENEGGRGLNGSRPAAAATV
jgi:hypothetical protein